VVSFALSHVGYAGAGLSHFCLRDSEGRRAIRLTAAFDERKAPTAARFGSRVAPEFVEEMA
jgi:hypothetical protein